MFKKNVLSNLKKLLPTKNKEIIMASVSDFKTYFTYYIKYDCDNSGDPIFVWDNMGKGFLCLECKNYKFTFSYEEDCAMISVDFPIRGSQTKSSIIAGMGNKSCPYDWEFDNYYLYISKCISDYTIIDLAWLDPKNLMKPLAVEVSKFIQKVCDLATTLLYHKVITLQDR